MTGSELKQLREDLGSAIGKRLSVADMAKIVGMAPANGADTIRKWEDGAGPSGPVGAQLQLLQLASNDYEIPRYMLIGASTACHRFGVDFRGGVPAENIFREMMREEIRPPQCLKRRAFTIFVRRRPSTRQDGSIARPRPKTVRLLTAASNQHWLSGKTIV